MSRCYYFRLKMGVSDILCIKFDVCSWFGIQRKIVSNKLINTMWVEKYRTSNLYNWRSCFLATRSTGNTRLYVGLVAVWYIASYYYNYVTIITTSVYSLTGQPHLYLQQFSPVMKLHCLWVPLKSKFKNTTLNLVLHR